MRDRETIGGIKPSHDATHDIKKFPGMEHAVPEDDSYRNLRKREPGKTFTPLEEMRDTDEALSNPEFVAIIRELRGKLKDKQLSMREIDTGDLAQEYGITAQQVEDYLTMDFSTGDQVKDYSDAEDEGRGEKRKRRDDISDEDSPSHFRDDVTMAGGTDIQQGRARTYPGGKAMKYVYSQRSGERPRQKPRYKASGDKYLKTVRTEQPPEQQAY